MSDSVTNWCGSLSNLTLSHWRQCTEEDPPQEAAGQRLQAGWLLITRTEPISAPCLMRYWGEESGWGRTSVKAEVWPLAPDALTPTLQSLAVRLLFVHGEVAFLGGRRLLLEAVAVGCKDGQQPLLLLLGFRQVGGRSGQENEALRTKSVFNGGKTSSWSESMIHL